MNQQSLPAARSSAQKLLLSTAIALLVAGAVLVTVVLPAEYAIDPTNIGGLLGLTAMGKSKTATTSSNTEIVATVATTPEAATVMHSHSDKFTSSRIEIHLKGDEELEYKATLVKGEPLLYKWTVSGGPVYFEFHGEPTEGTWPKDFYQSYEIKQSSVAEQGSFTAPFTGNHGWYWMNLNATPVTITLEAAGYYSKLERIGNQSTTGE